MKKRATVAFDRFPKEQREILHGLLVAKWPTSTPIAFKDNAVDQSINFLEERIRWEHHRLNSTRNHPTAATLKQDIRILTDEVKVLEHHLANLHTDIQMILVKKLGRTAMFRHQNALTVLRTTLEQVELYSSPGRPKDDLYNFAMLVASFLVARDIRPTKTGLLADILTVIFTSLGLPEQSTRITIERAWPDIKQLLAEPTSEFFCPD